MNTATQLLKEALGCVRLVQEDWSQHLQRNNGDAHAEAAIRHVALLREDIEAYLAKQQVEQEPAPLGAPMFWHAPPGAFMPAKQTNLPK
jgi:hypothetical protein